MNKRLIALALMVFLMIPVMAQEFKCDVRVFASQITNVDKSVFSTMRDAIYEFMNNRKWTEVNFGDEERIECTVVINVTEVVSEGVYKGELNIGLNRPVFQTSYVSPMFNYIDKDFLFEYSPSMTLDFADNAYSSELTSILAFYSYIFLGLDFDSFSLKGGETFFRAAETTASAAQNSSGIGWQAKDGDKNRYWLAENLNNASYTKLHDFYYYYHRQGLDVMPENAKKGRAAVTKAIESLQEVYRERPNLFIVQLIVETKRNEINNIFLDAEKDERIKVMNIMKAIDPAHGTDYDKVIAGKK